EQDWVEPLARITDAPGVRSDGSGSPLERIEVHDTRIRFLLPRATGGPVPLPTHGFEAKLRMEGPKTMAVEELRAFVFGGQLAGFGRVDWGSATSWHGQLTLVDLDIAHAAQESGALSEQSRGSASGFLDLAQTAGAPHLAGAGWIEGTDVRLWQQPLMAGLLHTLGVTAGPDDALREVRGRVHVDLGSFFVDEFTAKGNLLHLFGSGLVRLDGEGLDARLVPRMFAKDLTHVPVVGAPTQTLLDLLNGQLLEVRLTGSLSEVDVAVNPIASISAPLRAFLALFADPGK
ncbi:MAG: hypothetical protein ABIP94_05380, partial [Planctomycetota bacterium]